LKRETQNSKRTLYDKVSHMGLERKLIDISLAKAQIPRSLYDDVSQEIRISWLGAKANPKLSDGETASYAHTIAFHTALRVRRDLAGAVRLPGSAFRKRADGTTYVQPGHLAAPVPWEDLSEVLQTDEEKRPDVESEWEELPDNLDEEIDLRRPQSDLEQRLRRCLTKKQLRIISLLKRGHTLSQIERRISIQSNTLQRNLRIICRRISEES